MSKWSLTSWIDHTQRQQIVYPDKKKLQRILTVLSTLPPLVSLPDILTFKKTLLEAHRGKTFIIQGGTCAECFSECSTKYIETQLKLLHEMQTILHKMLKKNVVCIGRIAGQYAKPRTASEEIKEGIHLPSYRGDLLHHHEFTSEHRTPNPLRLLRGYAFSKKTINIIEKSRYPSVYFSHEALHLHYEQQLIHFDLSTQHWFLSSTHFPWIGAKTNFLGSAHIELLRGVINPIGLKIDEYTSIPDLLTSIQSLNPQQEPDRIVLIHRFGAKQLKNCLPPLIQAIKAHHVPVLWFCDPMHGNTERTTKNLKTRHFNAILSELTQSFEVHHQYGSQLHGIHLELSGEDVTECLGGSRHLTEDDLLLHYKSRVDPRLNYEQSLELTMRLGQWMRKHTPEPLQSIP